MTGQRSLKRLFLAHQGSLCRWLGKMPFERRYIHVLPMYLAILLPYTYTHGDVPLFYILYSAYTVYKNLLIFYNLMKKLSFSIIVNVFKLTLYFSLHSYQKSLGARRKSNYNVSFCPPPSLSSSLYLLFPLSLSLTSLLSLSSSLPLYLYLLFRLYFLPTSLSLNPHLSPSPPLSLSPPLSPPLSLFSPPHSLSLFALRKTIISVLPDFPLLMLCYFGISHVLSHLNFYNLFIPPSFKIQVTITISYTNSNISLKTGT